MRFGKQGNTLCLSVADDGVGCMQVKTELGTNLVRLLAEQLGGEAKWEALKPGCRVVAEIVLT